MSWPSRLTAQTTDPESKEFFPMAMKKKTRKKATKKGTRKKGGRKKAKRGRRKAK
jgi:hypothetical protein